MIQAYSLGVVSKLIQMVGPVPTGQCFTGFGRWEPALFWVLKLLLTSHGFNAVNRSARDKPGHVNRLGQLMRADVAGLIHGVDL